MNPRPTGSTALAAAFAAAEEKRNGSPSKSTYPTYPVDVFNYIKEHGPVPKVPPAVVEVIVTFLWLKPAGLVLSASQLADHTAQPYHYTTALLKWLAEHKLLSRKSGVAPNGRRMYLFSRPKIGEETVLETISTEPVAPRKKKEVPVDLSGRIRIVSAQLPEDVPVSMEVQLGSLVRAFGGRDFTLEQVVNEFVIDRSDAEALVRFMVEHKLAQTAPPLPAEVTPPAQPTPSPAPAPKPEAGTLTDRILARMTAMEDLYDDFVHKMDQLQEEMLEDLGELKSGDLSNVPTAHLLAEVSRRMKD